MADLSLVTAGRIYAMQALHVMTLPAGEAISAGQAVRLDTSTGKLVKAQATTAANARAMGVALKSVAAGEPVSALKLGIVDGFDCDSFAYDADVYLSDTAGTLTSGSGTVSKILGRIVPVWGQTLTSSGSARAADKALLVDL